MSVKDSLTKYTEAPYESKSALLLKRFKLLPSPEQFPKHIKAQALREQIGEKRFDNFFTFVFVRDPWDWQISLYEYMLRSKRHRQHKFIKSLSGFTEYIEWRTAQDCQLQKDFVVDNQGNVIVDFIGKYENLAADFQKICDRIGVQEQLPHVNQSKRRNFSEYYDQRTIDLVARCFQEDIEFFDYSPPSLVSEV